VGSLTLTIGVAAGYTNPASGYELPIYTRTPIGFWISVTAATAVAITVAVALCVRTDRSEGLGLAPGGGAFTAFVELSILRNYHYFGTVEEMTHLGWTRGAAVGEKGLLSTLSPGIHTFAAFIGEIDAYGGLRYFKRRFVAARNQRRVNDVTDNGEFDLSSVTG
jgi:hypothetical protein